MTKYVQRTILFLIVLCCFLAAKPIGRSLPPANPAANNPPSIETMGIITEAVPVTNSKAKITSSFESIAALPEKWESFRDLEHVQQSIKMNIYVPSSLPTGFRLHKVEHLQGVTRAAYMNQTQSIVFQQKQGQNKRNEAEEWTSTEGDEKKLTVAWSFDGSDFQITGDGVTQSELSLFKESLHMLSGDHYEQSLPYNIIETTEFSDVNNVKERRFMLFAPDEFLNFINKQRITIKDQFQPLDHSIVIGLFSGMKGSSGYTIEATNITLLENQLHISFKETEPSRDQIVLAYLTYPSQFINVALPPEGVSAVQFITEKGQAVANLSLDDR